MRTSLPVVGQGAAFPDRGSHHMKWPRSAMVTNLGHSSGVRSRHQPSIQRVTVLTRLDLELYANTPPEVGT
ncbi:hypothetical protein D8771_09365 [Streptomyces albus]|uniref:Uncharacterized protein n=1 Tax=Streptomyces albus TaxID=1888 RepID=A0A8H1QSV8_9ACTN|nr:hypothetical protein D8771_09365 [Streptomyces albus]